MSELTRLRAAVDDLASRSPSPDFGDLKRRATRRRGRRVAAAAVAAVAVILAGGGVVAQTVGGSDRTAPVVEPTTPYTVPPEVLATSQCDAMQDEAPPDCEEYMVRSIAIGTELYEAISNVPGWGLPSGDLYPPGYDYAFTGPCSGDLLRDPNSTGAGDGGAPSGRLGESWPMGLGRVHYRSEAAASDAAARFVHDLETCTVTAWLTHPIAQPPGGTVASSPDAVAWIQQKGKYVAVLQTPTNDGPPPVDVQVAIAEVLVDYLTLIEQQSARRLR